VSLSEHLRYVINFIVYFRRRRKFESLTHKGVANPLDFISNLWTFFKNNQVNVSLLLLGLVSNHMTVGKLFDVSEGFSSGCSENELLELFLVSCFNRTSDVSDLDKTFHISSFKESYFFLLSLDHIFGLLVVNRKLASLFVISIHQISSGLGLSTVAWRSVSHGRNHLLAILEHLIEVLLNCSVGLQLLQVGGLVKHELLVVFD